MKLADLDSACRAWLRTCRWDRFIEKHEGPESWKWHLDHVEDDEEDQPEFIILEGYEVLLPVGRTHYPQITVLRLLPSSDGHSLTLFLRDLTWAKFYSMDDAPFWAGFLAVCDKVPDADWYVTVLYHEVYLRPDLGPVGLAPWPS